VQNYIYSFDLHRLLPIHSHLNLNSLTKSTFNTNLSDPLSRSVRIPLRAAASSCGEITLSSLKPAARANPRSGLTPSRTWRAIVLSNRRFHRPHQLGLVSITIPGIVKSSSGWLSITHLPVIFFQISFFFSIQVSQVNCLHFFFHFFEV
jgi:hypothetical protein